MHVVIHIVVIILKYTRVFRIIKFSTSLTMICCKLRSIVVSSCICFFFIIKESRARSSFVVSFQSKGQLSIDQWMKYKKNITNIQKEFTACHWEKLRYFSSDSNIVWSYCYLTGSSDTQLKCWGFYHAVNLQSAGRNVDLTSYSEDWSLTAKNVKYKHRKWNHICVMYSSTMSFWKLYYNGEAIESMTGENLPDFSSKNSIHKSTFIIGQEPDIFEGGYDPAQLFNGELSEINIWNISLSKEQVQALAICNSSIMGNELSWRQEDFEINGARVFAVQSLNHFCQERKQLFIFPQKRTIHRARALCEIHGGKLLEPTSKEEANEALKIIQTHNKACLSSSNNIQEGKAAWLGMIRMNRKWHLSSNKNQLELVNYTNWDPNKCTTESCGIIDFGCAFLQTDGFWAFGLSHSTCATLEMCTICSFVDTPVFTLKGKCSFDGQLNWNYYMTVNESRQISGFDGYKTSTLTEKNGIWTFLDAGVSAHGSFDHPIGRKNWNYIDRTCEMKSKVLRSMTLSKCKFGNEFTCDSGQCIEMRKRCDGINDCGDASDEMKCNLVEIPGSYDKIVPPFIAEESHKPVPLSTRVDIYSIDMINTLEMMIGITFLLNFKWSDGRLDFHNLDSNGYNLISAAATSNLWLPSENIIHENAILGQIITDSQRIIGVTNLTTAMRSDTTSSIENYKFKGSNAQMFMSQRFKIMYSCIFELSKFPFDEHTCNFTMGLVVGNKSSITFTHNMPSVSYVGTTTVGQFRILNFTSKIENVSQKTGFIFSINIRRLVMNQMLNTFLPTTLLFLLAYSTLFIDIENFSDRFIGTVTALLVLVSLLSSVNDDLPKTSYFKFIDLWFLWYITNILLIIIFHIFVNHIPNNQVHERSKMGLINSDEEIEKSLRYKFNRYGIVVFAITTIVFVTTYFNLTI